MEFVFPSVYETRQIHDTTCKNAYGKQLTDLIELCNEQIRRARTTPGEKCVVFSTTAPTAIIRFVLDALTESGYEVEYNSGKYPIHYTGEEVDNDTKLYPPSISISW